MKRLFVLLQMLAVGVIVSAQPQMKITENMHDFGIFKEDAGPQKYDFVVTNTGNAPLVIQNIVPSCGCTTPEWTKQPIPGGASGRITAIYDPKDRPGKFNKTLTIYTNSKPEIQVIAIKGDVIPREKKMEEIFMFPVGEVRFESNHLAFTNIKKSEKKIRVMQIINPTQSDVKVEFDQLPQHLSLRCNPETLKPGQKGIIEGTYDATKNPGAWGMVNDMIRIKTNGVAHDNVFLYISANLVEDFSSLSKDELENAPVFELASNNIELGKIPGQISKEAEWKFTNTGKRDLVIRYIKSTCGCTAIQQGNQGEGIKPGESGSIKAVFNSGMYKGKVTKPIYVYTNDPKKSELVLYLSADVVQPEVK